MKEFKLYWLDGTTEVVTGDDVCQAVRRAGIGAGAIPALDYYEEVTSEESPGIACLSRTLPE